jgi:hypothetical protein
VRITQLVTAAEGWRAMHYDPDDDEVYEVPLVAFALVETPDGGTRIHPVGMYDLAATCKADEPFSFTDQDSTFIELLAPAGCFTLEKTETPQELEQRIRAMGQRRKLMRLSEAGDAAEERAWTEDLTTAGSR